MSLWNATGDTSETETSVWLPNCHICKSTENLGISMQMFYEEGEHGTKIVIIGMKIKKGVTEVGVNTLLPQWK